MRKNNPDTIGPVVKKPFFRASNIILILEVLLFLGFLAFIVLNKFFLKYKWHFLFGTIFVALSNYFRVLQPQMIREALDLVLENISLYRQLDGFELQGELFGILGKTLLFFGVLVLVLALIMGLFMYFMRQTRIVMSRLIEYDMRKE